MIEWVENEIADAERMFELPLLRLTSEQKAYQEGRIAALKWVRANLPEEG